MLVTGQNNIIVQLSCQLAGYIFPAVTELCAGDRILLKSAVIYEHAYITHWSQYPAHLSSLFISIKHSQMLQILRLLPYIYMIGNYAGNAYAQTI